MNTNISSHPAPANPKTTSWLAERMVMNEIIQRSVIVLIAVVALFLLFDALEHSQINLLRESGLRIFFLQQLIEIPSRVYELLPLATLLGCIWALSLLGKHHELTILRVSGFTVARLMRLLALFGFCVGLMGMLVDEWLDPFARRTINQAIHALHHRPAPSESATQNNLWVRSGPFFIRVDRLQEEHAEGVWIVELSPNFNRLRQFTYAQSATIVDTTQPSLVDGSLPSAGANGVVWQLENGFTRLLPDSPFVSDEQWESPNFALLQSLSPLWLAGRAESTTPFTRQDWTMGPHWRYLLRQDISPKAQKLTELWPRYFYNRANALSNKTLSVSIWKKMFYPLMIVVMAITGLPFCLQTGRLVQTNLRILIGIILGVVFFVTQGIFSSLGILALPPIPSVLAPLFIFFSMTLFGVYWAQRR